MSERYELKGKIGEGGIGTVHKAFDTQLKRDVAIKRLIPVEGGNTAEAAGFINTSSNVKYAGNCSDANILAMRSTFLPLSRCCEI